MLRGEHLLRLHGRAEDGRPEVLNPAQRLQRGCVALPEPEILPMFQIDNPDRHQPGVGIHVYGGVLAGLQSLSFDERGAAHAHVFSYANSWIPNLWARRPAGPRAGSLSPGLQRQLPSSA